jgi:hypothetical protein
MTSDDPEGWWPLNELPEGYVTRETSHRVVGQQPDLVTRFRWRADRRCAKLNADVRVPFYRWEVCEWHDGRWAVVAMQNVAVPLKAVDDEPPAA